MRSFIFLDWYFAGWLFGVAMFLIFLLWQIKVFWEIKNIIICASVFLLAIGLGISRYNIADIYPPLDFYQKIGQKISLEGIVINEPEVKDTNQKITVKLEKQNVLVTTGLEKYFDYGDRVILNGVLILPENFITPLGKSFDYISYLKKDKIFFLMNYPNIKVVNKGEGNPLKRFLYKTKSIFLEKLNAVIPSPESTLLGGLILGERSGFSTELRQQFVDTGTIHIVALSGYNVTMIAEWIMKLFSWLPIYWAFFTGVIGIFLFVLMSGGQATAVRAGIMASLAIVAKATGREYDVWRGIVFVALLMVILNPFVLVYDVSFQLSFLATIAVIFFTPLVQKYFFWIENKWWREMIATTFSAYVFVIPFVVYKMGNLSLVSLPANILVLPTIPITMIFGFLGGFLNLFSHIIAFPFLEFTYFLLHWKLFVIDLLARIPLASLQIKSLPLILVLMIYVFFSWKIYSKSF
ncbi:MAG: ComEC family competence protein [Candidatus Pacebacteria bacterium]|nr:ComEC family competence protein [Candidatus Paceibacterota bacterium]MCF7862654.1 ComEC family competence protein [Candidatus Paceibacterota bacterium]